ncbi:MAG: glycosyltransferase [Planktothrix sp.]
MPTISVIIPAYNSENTIQETIESVLNQTFQDLELIVINDGSVDKTLEVISSFSDARIQVFSYSNSGAQKSRNRGISHASGEYLSFLDSDDMWEPEKLEFQLKALQENSEAAVAYSWTNWIDESGKFLRRGSYISKTGDIFANLLLVDFIENGSNPLIRANAMAEVGYFDESLVGGQDWDMWLRLAARYPFVAVPYPHILYRQSANSWSSNVERQESGFLQVIEKALNQESQRVSHLKNHIIANRYKCLLVDILDRFPAPERGLTAARFLKTVLINDPAMLKARVLAKVIFKILVLTILPPKQAMRVLKKVHKFSNLQALMGYLKLDPL